MSMDPHEWIKDALRQSRMSASELARQTGVTRQAVSRWLHPDPRKRTTPEDQHLVAIAEATGVPLGEKGNGDDRDPISPHEHGRKALFMRDVRRLVRKENPDLLRNFDRPVEIPGARLSKFDYVSNRLAMCVTVGAPRGVAWRLALLARADLAMRNEREVVLCVMGKSYVHPGELRLLDVEPVPVNSPEDVARVILAAETR